MSRRKNTTYKTGPLMQSKALRTANQIERPWGCSDRAPRIETGAAPEAAAQPDQQR